MANEELPGLDEYLNRGKWSEQPTAYAVACGTCGLVYLTPDEYDRQMNRMNETWACPKCGGPADWDDENYESFNE